MGQQAIFYAVLGVALALAAGLAFYIYRARTKVNLGTAVQAQGVLQADIKVELDAMKESVDELGKKLSKRRESLKRTAG